jgi:quinohemoprotein amine dehydrogenase
MIGCLLLAAEAVHAEGFPIKSQVVRDACGSCHKTDSEGKMSRISYMRKSPEGWEETVRRMARIRGVSITPEEARKVVQYLADNQGLTASELEPVAYAIEQEDAPEKIPNDTLKNACATCHSFAKVAAQRRTREEWVKVKDFLLGMYPTLIYQHRHEDWMVMADESLAWFADHYPLETPEWKKEKDQPPPGDSQWIILGHQPGKGDYSGVLSFRSLPDGNRESQAELVFEDGKSVKVLSKGRWFGGYAWRGNSTLSEKEKVREMFHLSADQKTMRGRWFPPEHPELGAKEVRYRVDGQPQVLAVLPGAIRRGAAHTSVRIIGINLPSAAGTGSLNLGEGIKIERVTGSVDHMDAVISVEPGAKPGSRTVHAGSAGGPARLIVYDKVDYIRVVPDRAMGRLGGIRYPKRFVQFEAHAYSNGSDGVPATSDDLDLGPVKASWSTSEAYAAYSDKDVPYVGTVDQNGLFIPAVEGPNAVRPRVTNNAGDVWVEASYAPQVGQVPLKARAYILVTIPRYVQLQIP